MKFKFSIPKTIDWIMYLVPVILTIAGIVVIYSLTYFNPAQSSIFHNQIIYGVIGVLLMIVFTFIDYRNFKGLAWYLYIIGVVLLVSVLLFGTTLLGAKRWLDLGITQIQPAEIFKFFLIIVLAKFFADRGEKIRWQDLLIACLIFAVPFFLIMRQPDLGTSVVLFVITLAIIFASRLKKIQIFTIGLIIVCGVCGSWFILKDYQKERLYTFINPSADPYGSGYNIAQSTITIGSGGFLGRGLGHGPQSQLNFLPVAHTDFIFAGVAEATGFVGSTVLIILLGLLVYRIISVARISKDKFGMYFGVAVGTMMLFQGFVNVGMNLGIMPVTGIPLPFVSAGGTALITNFICIGILQSIYLRHKKISF